jgi:hypothetical protein
VEDDDDDDDDDGGGGGSSLFLLLASSSSSFVVPTRYSSGSRATARISPMTRTMGDLFRLV